MNTLLIVEDNEQVRKNLVRMVKQSDVKIGRIIECPNGKEALRVLKDTKVELVFSDIHMPELDGCELTSAIANMEINEMRKTKVVIISGFEDFQCAVELLKYGARDYILKPVDKNALNDVLLRMESEIQREDKRTLEIERIYRQHVRDLLKNAEAENEDVWDILEHVFDKNGLGQEAYRLILTNPEELGYPIQAEFSLDRVFGDLYFIFEKNLQREDFQYPEGYCAGVSKSHTTVKEIQIAYQEALAARKVAFVKGSTVEIYREYEFPNSVDLSLEAEHFQQQFPIEEVEFAGKRFRKLCFDAKHFRISPLKLVDLINELTRKMNAAYENVYSQKTGGSNCPNGWEYRNVDAFLAEFEKWMEECRRAAEEQTIHGQTGNKIQYALEYIHTNYQRDLNLAIVSNHVSMNYSMFSNAFKKYTGVNFVNYLKAIRITEAKRLLETSDKKIAEIGRCVGYANDKHFMKTFKAISGVSPSEYRRNMELIKMRHDKADEKKI